MWLARVELVELRLNRKRNSLARSAHGTNKSAAGTVARRRLIFMLYYNQNYYLICCAFVIVDNFFFLFSSFPLYHIWWGCDDDAFLPRARSRMEIGLTFVSEQRIHSIWWRLQSTKKIFLANKKNMSNIFGCRQCILLVPTPIVN